MVTQQAASSIRKQKKESLNHNTLDFLKKQVRPEHIHWQKCNGTFEFMKRLSLTSILFMDLCFQGFFFLICAVETSREQESWQSRKPNCLENDCFKQVRIFVVNILFEQLSVFTTELFIVHLIFLCLTFLNEVFEASKQNFESLNQ